MWTLSSDIGTGHRRGAETAASKPARRSAEQPTPLFRKLTSTDAADYEAHLLRLGPADRRMRFCGSVSDTAVSDYCAAIDWARTVILACFVDRDLRGAAELRLLDSSPLQAEFALTIEDGFQDRGLGTELLRRSLIAARNRCVTTVTMICMIENARMQRIAKKFDSVLALEDGEIEGRLRTSWPTYLSLLEEAAGDAQAWFRARSHANAQLPAKRTA
ncbi:GNAT family N-acetyltransferase [Algihabitans albus]|uniref:GNAT family N-acetyltransferase n=1 Tax=Algihabitans albus TaxID=2164067 RepID=UPI000E5CE7F5|nr:GNAT family N-acetyltransferase [Algihabitans albus]